MVCLVVQRLKLACLVEQAQLDQVQMVKEQVLFYQVEQLAVRQYL
jgi:hypothetical protein